MVFVALPAVVGEHVWASLDRNQSEKAIHELHIRT